MINNIRKVLRCEAEVDRNHYGTDLRHGIERFQFRMCVRRYVSDAVTLANAKLLQGGRPAIAAFKNLCVVPTLGSIDDGFAFWVKPAGAAGEFKWG